MKKRFVVSLILVILFLLPTILATSVDDEMQKITHYAEEYEIGNIDYIQLLLYTSAVREALNEELGAIGKHEGGLLKQEQIEKILGGPTEETKWAWAEIEGPPWDRKPRPVQKVKEVVTGIKMWFKMRAMLNSAKVFPKEAEKDMEFLSQFFFAAMGLGAGGPGEGPEDMEEMDKDGKGEMEIIEGGLWESKEKITGEIIG